MACEHVPSEIRATGGVARSKSLWKTYEMERRFNWNKSNITSRFFNRLKSEYKALVEKHMADKNDKCDFEKCIASVEKYYEALHHHQNLNGRKFGEVNGLDLTVLEKSEKSIQESIYLFSALIVEIIHGHIKLPQIDAHLRGFVKWLTSILDGPNEVDLLL